MFMFKQERFPFNSSCRFRTFYSSSIQTERLKLLLPQGHAFHLTEVIQQSLRATAVTKTKGEGESESSQRQQLGGENLEIPLQVADHQLLDAGIGGLDGLAQFLEPL